ncbi:MAG: FtsQ-type POTRA domain-containing protein [Solirubrobacteraceae bacterium]
MALLGGGWLWLRDSSLVAVEHVTITGVSGPDATQVRTALVLAARDMTTLDVQTRRLRTAVAPYPVVKAFAVSTQFPHGMRIHVIEQVPVAVVVAGGVRTAVSSDGTLLHDVTAAAGLPAIALGVAPGGTRVGGITLSEVRLLAAAPYALLAKVQAAGSDAAHGLTAQLRDGPAVYFGADSQLTEKWAALAAVLSAPSSAGASYIDVSVPRRPVAGTGGDQS